MGKIESLSGTRVVLVGGYPRVVGINDRTEDTGTVSAAAASDLSATEMRASSGINQGGHCLRGGFLRNYFRRLKVKAGG